MMNPITRKEMFLAKAMGADVETPTPITRMEVLLSSLSGGGGMTELPEGYPYKSGMTIEWDGNTEGLSNIMGVLFHVSDVIISDDDLKNSTLVMSTGETTVVKDRWDYNVSHQMIILGGDFTYFNMGFIARKNNLEVNMFGASFVVEKAGIYFIVNPEMSDQYLASLSFGEVRTMAPEFLPSEEWTFTLEDGTTVTKKVVVAE